MVKNDVVTLWHGTLDVAAKKIVKEGLIPAKKRTWDFLHQNYYMGLLFPMDEVKLPFEKGIVYITESKERAEWYAKFRKWYGGISPGENTYEWIDSHGELSSYSVIKPLNSRFVVPPRAKPVLLKVEIPRAEFKAMKPEEDPQDTEFRTWMVHTKIPAQYVKEVIPVPVGV